MDLNRNMEEYEIQQGECCPHSLSTKYQIAVYKISGNDYYYFI